MSSMKALGGPYDVGAIDVCFRAPDCRALKADQHVSGRVYYPCKAPMGTRTWLRIPCFWLPHRNYAYGYARYLFFWARGWRMRALQHLTHGILWILGSAKLLPLHYNAPLATAPPSRAGAPSATDASTDGSAGSAATAAEPAVGAAGPNSATAAHQACEHQQQAAPLHTTPSNSNSGSSDPTPSDSGSPGWLNQPHDPPFPVILFSHGLAGNATTYSTMCTQLASKGYVVFAVEHADGTASAARLAHGSFTDPPPGVTGSWRFYAGLGDKQAQEAKTRYRVTELHTALSVLRALAQGRSMTGLKLSCGSPDPGAGNGSNNNSSSSGGGGDGCGSSSGCGTGGGSGSSHAQHDGGACGLLAGLIDLTRVAVVGHSYGGATTALAVSEDDATAPSFHCGVALDPWWEALPQGCVVLQRGEWLSKAPLLVLGSHDWNTPDALGNLKCNGERQEAVLKAAAAGRAGRASGAAGATAPGAAAAAPAPASAHGATSAAATVPAPAGPHSSGTTQSAGGPGAILAVPTDSTHHSYDDVLLFFGSLMKPILTLFGFHDGLAQDKAINIFVSCIHHFISEHLHLAQGRGQPPVAGCDAQAPAGGGNKGAVGGNDGGQTGGGPGRTSLEHRQRQQRQQQQKGEAEAEGDEQGQNDRDAGLPAAELGNHHDHGCAAAAAAVDPKPIAAHHLEAYRSKLGQDLAILRAACANAAGGCMNK